MMPMLMFRIVPTILLLAFFPSCAVSQMNPPNFSTHTFSVRQDEGLNTDSLKINLLKPLGIRRSSVIVPPDGWMFNYENMLMWGLRARIQQQYSYNGTHVVADRNVTCAYLWVDEDVQTLPFSSAGIYSSQYKTYPNRLYLRWWGGLDETNIPPNFFEWLMNATIFIDRKSSFCQNVAGFNVSWSLEYRYSQFSFITSKYLSQMNETCTYDDYNPKSNVLFVTERMSMHDEQEVLEYTSMENYPSGEMDKPSGWLCGRGAGNGTWYWDCGPMQGMAFNYTNWAPGEPSIPDGCLFMCQQCGINKNSNGLWYSLDCTSLQIALVSKAWKSPRLTYGYIHVKRVAHPTWWAQSVELESSFLQKKRSRNTTIQFLYFVCMNDCVGVTVVDFALPCLSAALISGGLFSKVAIEEIVNRTYVDVVSGDTSTTGAVVINITLGWSTSLTLQGSNTIVTVPLTFHSNSPMFCEFTGSFSIRGSSSDVKSTNNITQRKKGSPLGEPGAIESCATAAAMISLMNPSPAYQVLPSALISPCSNVQVFNESVLSHSPLYFVLPESVRSFKGAMNRSVGSIFWNLILVGAITSLHFLVVILFWCKKEPLTTTMSRLKFPTLSLVVIVLLVQGTTVHTMLFFTHAHHTNVNEFFVIPLLGALIIPIGVTGFAWYMISRGRVGLASEYRSYNHSDSSRWRQWLLPQGHWVNEGNVNRFGVLYDAYSPRGRWT
eukprot:PhF_6_TR36479/c0_g1_i3/m.53578